MSAVVLPHEVRGNGPHRVLALHGWFADRTAYAGIWPYLDENAFSYAFVDYRGYGAAKDIEGSYDIEEAAGDALAVADELGWERFSVLGHSMGGKAADAVLALAPDRVRAIVGLAPVPAGGIPFDEQGWALFSSAPDDAGSRRTIIDMTTGNRLTGVWLDQMTQASLLRSTVPAFRSYLESFANVDFHQRVEGSQVPVLVLVGEHDPAITTDVARGTWLTWHPNAELLVLSGVGHYPADEAPIALVSAVEAFLAKR